MLYKWPYNNAVLVVFHVPVTDVASVCVSCVACWWAWPIIMAYIRTVNIRLIVHAYLACIDRNRACAKHIFGNMLSPGCVSMTASSRSSMLFLSLSAFITWPDAWFAWTPSAPFRPCVLIGYKRVLSMSISSPKIDDAQGD